MTSSEDSLDKLLSEEDDELYHIRRSLKMLNTLMDGCEFEASKTHSFIILGASGNLAMKKIYPALWCLFRNSLLPKTIFIIGFARSSLTVDQIQTRSQSYMKANNHKDEEKYRKYWATNIYVKGQYDNIDDFRNLNNLLVEKERGQPGNRIFYIALPPNVVNVATVNIKNNCMPASGGYIRIILEKPYGRDLQSSDALTNHLINLFTEAQIFRLDHDIGNEIIQNVITLRFSNIFLSSTWNRQYITSVLISSKEDVGLHGRGGYFDHTGIIRDVMQTHLMQILTFIAMDKPSSCLPEDIRDEKVKLLKTIKPLRLRDFIIGQYIGNPNGIGDQRFGYLDDITVPRTSVTPTYAITVLEIRNERWEGVPFILICGKALNEQRTEVRMQYSAVPGNIFESATRNEFVMTIKPTQSIYMKFFIKSPGIDFFLEDSRIDMMFPNKHSNMNTLESYPRLILDIVCGTHLHCIRSDELHEMWRIFTPILHQIEEDRIRPLPYKFGSQGPREAELLLRQYGCIN